MIPSIIDGSCLGSFAFLERQSRYEIADVVTTAVAADGGYVINGEKTVVVHGGTANKFIVTARSSGEQFDAEGVSLFMVDAAAEGVSLKSYQTMDGQRAATVQFDNVRVQTTSCSTVSVRECS